MLILFITYIASYVSIGRTLLINYINTTKYSSQFNLYYSKVLDIERELHSSYSPISILIGFILITVGVKLIYNIISKIILGMCRIRFFSKHTKVDLKNKEKSALLIQNCTATNIKKTKTKHIFEFKDKGISIDDIINKLTRLSESDISDDDKKFLNNDDSELDNIASKAAEFYSYSNLLHSDVYSSARHIESELIKMNINFFSGNDKEVVGCTTFGGTDSLLLSLMCYRNILYKQYGVTADNIHLKSIVQPEVIISAAAPAVYFKIADMLNLKLCLVDIDNEGRIIVKKVAKLINSRTACIIGLFPNLAYGTLDDIEELSKIAIKKSTYLHVDANYGGYLACFSQFSGSKTILPKYDFLLPGVSSLSADTHRFGKAPSGIGILIYRNSEIRKHQYYLYPKWMGGLYITPSMAGSRTASMVVASYMILLYYGKGEFRNQFRYINETVDSIRVYVKNHLSIDSKLKVIGNPQLSIISIGGEYSVYMYQLMRKKEWELGLSLSAVNNMNIKNNKKYITKDPKDSMLNEDSFSFSITMGGVDIVNDLFTKDLQSSYNELKANNYVLDESEEVNMIRTTGCLPKEMQSENFNKMLDAYLDMN